MEDREEEYQKQPHGLKKNSKRKDADTANADQPEKEKKKIGLYASIFSDLTWEVDCTAKVLKFLQDRKVPHDLKTAAIKKIKMLGNGEWRGRLCKPLDGLPKQCDMKLYEAKLSKDSRILWEQAVAFSSRCSGDCQKMLESDVRAGEVTFYSEVIRIWDIVLDHSKVSHAIKVIVNSVERGKGCIIRKNLIGICKRKIKEGTTKKELRMPTFFREVSGTNYSQDVRVYSPPADTQEDVYHVLKLYPFTCALVNAVLNDSNFKVELPFQVTEVEHAIINLQPKPSSSIVLLGRSGTGKTTCCLYRMWTRFCRYWYKAHKIGEAWIPRDRTFMHRDGAEEDGGDESDRALKHCSKTVPPTMDHLHQVFITKNPVLCGEVHRNFRNMTHGYEFATEPLTQQDQPIPHRLQNVHQAGFPLFLSSWEFLLLLDASLPNPFFPRDADGSLKQKIHGRDKEKRPLTHACPMNSDDEEDGEKNDAAHPNLGRGAWGNQGHMAAEATNYDPRREVTYEVFVNELWPLINKKKLSCHPTLVWMEITSFIKGSVEALQTDSGCLSLEEYSALGKKRASNFSTNRKEIYKLFERYEHLKRAKNHFDEGDLVFHVNCRLRDTKRRDWAIHEFYVDETQDFTQAELSLIIQCSQYPNSLFLTGDTAQSIMRGVAFRFCDLQSLFYYASQSAKAQGKRSSAVTVPKKIYQLTQNYRSHSGILNLASVVIDTLTHFFPNSFDHLEPDQSLFDGPTPVLLESSNIGDLSSLLGGSMEEMHEIEFGAHQVILVANEDAYKKVPAVLHSGVVMTICQAKGLEFDDVLLYNFFKDSLADKEWRVTVGFQPRDCSGQRGEAIKEIDPSNLFSTKQPHRLEFKPDEHKILNSELKYLYTAITRARVNLWIFDEDETKRAPMINMFRSHGLVRGLEDEADSAGNTTGSNAAFAKPTSQSEWIKQGNYFSKNKRFEAAEKCYERAHHAEEQSRRIRNKMDALRMRICHEVSWFQNDPRTNQIPSMVIYTSIKQDLNSLEAEVVNLLERGLFARAENLLNRKERTLLELSKKLREQVWNENRIQPHHARQSHTDLVIAKRVVPEMSLPKPLYYQPICRPESIINRLDRSREPTLDSLCCCIAFFIIAAVVLVYSVEFQVFFCCFTCTYIWIAVGQSCIALDNQQYVQRRHHKRKRRGQKWKMLIYR